MRKGLLRRDQVWFTEKDSHGVSDLYSLVEYKINQAASVRNDASFGKDYLTGWYGAIPYFGDIEKFIRDEKDVPEDKIFMKINFKDVDMSQCPPGQDCSDWEDLKLLSHLMKKIESICQTTRMEAVAQKYRKVYGKFPSDSHFECPNYI